MNRGAKDEEHGVRYGMYAARPRVNQSSDDAASAEHRRKLEAIFANNTQSHKAVAAAASTAHVVPRVSANPARPLRRSPSEYSMRLERLRAGLRMAREPDEIREAADVFLSCHQLPDDMEILLKVLQHPSERVLRETIGQISSLIIQGRIGNTFVLKNRLSDISTRDLEPTTKLYIEGLKRQLAALADN